MAFAVNTFETNPSSKNLGFAFHEKLGEGQEVYFLGKFPENTAEPKMVAERIFGAIVDSFASSKGSEPYDRFEDALKAANLEARKNKQRMPRNPDIVVAYFDFNDLYLTQSGGSEAYLVRGATISQISEVPEKGNDLFMNILSGQVSVDDTVIFSTSRLLRVMTASQLSDIFSRSNFDDSVRIFRHELSANSEEEMLVTVVGVGKKTEMSSAGFLSKVVSKIKSEEETPVARGIGKKTVHIEAVEEDVEIETDARKFSEEDMEELAEEMVDRQESRMQPRTTQSNFKTNVASSMSPLMGKLKSFQLPPRKNLFIIGGTILGIFVVWIAAQSIMNYESAETKLMREKLSIARESIQQADTLLIQGDRKTAAESLQTAQSAVQTILSSKSATFRSDATFLLADIQEKQLQVENAKKVTPQLLADLSVKNENIQSLGLMGLKGNLFAYDLHSVYKTVRNIVEKGLSISDKESVIAGTARPDQNSLIFITDAPRIVEYNEGVITSMGTEDETWKKGIDIKGYGRYVYVLDPVENQIWKYERRRAKYSPAVPYNQGGDLSRAVSFTIDGAVYILSDDGTIQKLFRGAKTNFAFRDLPTTPFAGKNLRVYTSPELDFLYVLDPENSRILIFVKEEQFATYKKQVLFDVPGVHDFVVDDSGQKVNLLTNDKIYEFSL